MPKRHSRMESRFREEGREGLPLWLTSITVRKPKPPWERGLNTRAAVTSVALLFLSHSSPPFVMSQTSVRPPPPFKKKRKLNNIFNFTCVRLVFGTVGPNLTRRLIPASFDGRKSAIKLHYVVFSFDLSPPMTIGLLRLI